MRRLASFGALAAVALLSACAQSPESIVAVPTSSNQYAGYSCQQIRQENARVNAQLNSLNQAQAQAASGDRTTVGLAILFLPIAGLAAAGGPDYATEIAQLKGQSQTLQAMAASCVG